MKMNSDPNWLKKMADAEDGCDVSVGSDLRDLSTDQLLGLMDPILRDYSAALDEIRRRLTPEPLCPDSPDGNHHIAPIGSDEDLTLACTDCWYCGEKATVFLSPDTPSIEEQVLELKAGGWSSEGGSVWKSPAGALYRGPHGAWKVMKAWREGYSA